MSIQFLSLKYQYKLTNPVSASEEQRLLALMATHDLAAIGYLITHTAEMLSSDELPPHINEAELLQGYAAIGRLLSGLSNQAIGAIEAMGEILESNPPSGTGGAGGEFLDDDPLAELFSEENLRKHELSQAA